MPTLHDVIVVGAGPAGLSASLCSARLGLHVLLIERGQIGGHLVNLEAVGDYPGFPGGIQGAELGMKMYEQASLAGVQSAFGEVTDLKITGEECMVTAFEEVHSGKTLILCSGLSPMKLGLPREDELSGKGVSYCAVCDGPLYKGRSVAVVGSGDLAVEDALHLSQFAHSVTVVCEGSELQAGGAVGEKLSARENIHFLYQSKVESILGQEGVTALRMKNTKTGEGAELATDGVFISVGLAPNTQCARGSLPLSATGHLVADDSLRVRVPHVFAAGEVRQGSLSWTAALVGDGARAAWMARQYLTGR